MNTTLYLGTWNVGPGTTADALDLLDRVHALALQEAGDQARMLNRLEAKGYRAYRGKGKGGQASTPLVYNPQFLRPIDNGWFCEPMTKRTRGEAGGKGPRTSKAKWVVGGLFRHVPSRRLVALGSTHVVASVYLPTRRRLARQHVAGVADAFAGFRGLVFIMGDFNMTPTNGLLDPLYRAGWLNTHSRLGTLPTHGDRAIDYIWWHNEPGRVGPVEHSTVTTHSDHRALVAEFEVAKRGVPFTP